MALQRGFETIEDPTLSPTTMEVPPYLHLIQQLRELQRENIELHKERTNELAKQNSYVWKPERHTLELDFSDGDWVLFMDTWGRYKMCLLMNEP